MNFRIAATALLAFAIFAPNCTIKAVLPPKPIIVNRSLTTGEEKCLIATIGTSAAAIALASIALSGGAATAIVGAGVGALIGNEAFKAYIENKRKSQAIERRMRGGFYPL